MGCTNSKSSSVVGSSQATRSKNRGLNPVQSPSEISEEELHRMKEDALQRHDTEIDILTQLAEEREALKAVSGVRIAKRQSCEDLMESLSAAEFGLLHDQKWQRNLQKKFHTEKMKKYLHQKCKEWVLYNNVEAIDDESLTMMGHFMRKLLLAVAKKHPEIQANGDIVGQMNDEVAEPVGAHHNYMVSLVRKYLKRMKIVTVAPLSYYQLKPQNLYEYELPPGLVTVNEATVVIELYRRGGKLATSSVHKLLRLGYKILKDRKNVCHVEVDEEDKLIVVGDLHGQLADLLHIVDAAGMPGNNHTKYIFNGDFVDRGEWGVEVMLILLSLLVARPDCVYLNRGNHEDFPICSVYGFQQECCDKYDPVTFALFIEVFQQLPLYCVINEEIFVVHGGLFHTTDITLDDLNALDRTTFTLDESSANTDDFDPVPRSDKIEFWKQIGRDSLWSDPVDRPGRHVSQRGAGISFGPDVTKAFLDNNNFKFVIRSHECIRSGYDEPYQQGSSGPDDNPMLCTIFSASDYGGSGNSAAYLEIKLNFNTLRHLHRKSLSAAAAASTYISNGAGDQLRSDSPPPPALLRHPSISSALELPIAEAEGENTSQLKLIPDTHLFYTVHYFYANPLRFDDMQFSAHHETMEDLTLISNSMSATNFVPITEGDDDIDGKQGKLVGVSSQQDLEGYKQTKLVGSGRELEDLICERKQLLYDNFLRMDTQGHGHLHMKDWLKVMSESFNVSLSWKKFAQYLILPSVKSTCEQRGGEEAIDPLQFLESFQDEVMRALLGTEEERMESMQDLHRFIDTLNHPAEEKKADEVEKPTADTVNNNDVVLTLVSSSSADVDDRFFHGHDVPEEVIEAIYTNHKYLKVAFDYFDSNKDGLFTMSGFKKGLANLGLDQDLSTLGTTAEKLVQVMDIYECGEIDLNVFFEVYRLCCMNALYVDDASTRPLLRRGTTVAAEIHRLSISASSTSLLVNAHHPAQNSLASVELKRGKELGVDAELATHDDLSAQDAVGLSIDI